VNNMPKVKRALLSVSDKKGIIDLARGLNKLGIEIISTGGTAKQIKEVGVPVIPIEEITDYPEMMNGRVKTLHPAIHGGILALRDNEKHMKEIKNQDIVPIDMVVCNLYPFAETIAREDTGLEEAVENIDIGGPTMIRSAAKNFQDLIIVVTPSDYKDILTELEENNGDISDKKRMKLAYKAFRHTAEYDYRVQNYFYPLSEEDDLFPENYLKMYNKKFDLRYGENPHQQAAFYSEEGYTGASISTAEQLSGKELSYNNINDADAALELIKDFNEKPAVAVIKHTNPCGMAEGEDILNVFKRAYAGDPVSAFGSIVAINQKVNDKLAKEIIDGNRFLEIIIAPDFSSKAIKILMERWNNLRLLKTDDLSKSSNNEYDLKKVSGGLLVQEKDVLNINTDEWELVTSVKLDQGLLADLVFSWKVAKHVKSNAIIMAKDEMLIGVGAGQMSRLDSMIIAGRKAAGRQENGVVASDAFFPFADSIKQAAEFGIKAIIQPGGSIRDEEVIAEAEKNNISMIFTKKRHFKH